MTVIKELTLLSIVEVLAQNYPHTVEGKKILVTIGKDRRDDVEKCLFYLMDIGYVLSELRGMKVEVGEITPIEDDNYRLTASGIGYLDDYNKRITEILKGIKRKPLGFQADNK